MFIRQDDAYSAVSVNVNAQQGHSFDDSRVGYRLLGDVTFALLLIALLFAAVTLCV